MELPNVIFIVVDTLRKDYAKPLEEELKKFGFISYENAIAPASWTTPSHASIFTGLYPALHGAHKNKKDIEVKFKNRNSILSLRLQDMGYKTYLLSANPYIRPGFGFIGFEYFYDSPCSPPPPLLSDGEKEEIKKLKQEYDPKTKFEFAKTLVQNKRYKLIMKAGLTHLINRPYLYAYSVLKDWPKDKGAKNLTKALEELLAITKRKKPKFIFINLMEVHEPYFLLDKLRGKILIENLKANKLDVDVVQKWKKKYPEEVKYVTKKISEIMKILKGRNLFDNSLIMVTSDHGQLLGEYGRIGHGTFLYDELLRIPLLIKYPKNIEIEITKQDLKYISLLTLKPLIMNILKNKISNDNILYSDTVFAESYGIHVNLGKLFSEKEKKNIEQLEKYRVAVYHKNCNGIFNVEKWKFEEIISHYPDKEVTEEITKQMKKEVIKFLKSATTIKSLKIKI